MNIKLHILYLVVVCCLLFPLCLSQQRLNILYDELSATLVGSAPYTLALLPPNVNDPAQQWTYSNGFIISVKDPIYVFDIPGSTNVKWTRVGVYPQKPAPAPNQQWYFNPDGSIESQMIAGLYLFPANDATPNYLAIDYSWVVAHVEPAINKSWYCESSGDPHIYPFPRGRLDLWSPGLMAPGDYILAAFGNTTVYANQVGCGPAVYCNDKLAVESQGHTVVIYSDNVTIDGHRTVISGSLDLGDGLVVTRTSKGNYVVNVPGGYVEVFGLQYEGHNMENIYIMVESGPEPTGGLCTEFIGPNAPANRWGCFRSLPYTLLQFADSWKIRTFCTNPFDYISIEEWQAANPTYFNSSTGNVTTNDPVLNANAQSLCSPLLEGPLVTSCAQYVAPAPYHQSCLDDVIASTALEFAAPIINAYSVRCSQTASDPSSVVLPTAGNRCVAYGPGLGPIPPLLSTQFTISARNALRVNRTQGGEFFSVNSTGPEPLIFTVVDNENGFYTVLFTPFVSGIYEISVLFRGVDAIANSPFRVVVQTDGDNTDPSQSTASGLGLASPIFAGIKYPFTVQARTSAGTNRTVGGDAIQVAVTGDAFISTRDANDGSYIVIYQQNLSGQFYVYVLLNGVQIKGSPFAVTAT